MLENKELNVAWPPFLHSQARMVYYVRNFHRILVLHKLYENHTVWIK
jgi:hypothetical protein